MKIKKTLIKKIKEAQETFVEKYNLGELSGLMVFSFYGGCYNFTKLDSCWKPYEGNELVFHITPDHGVVTGFVSQWV